jgi:hypothetical protein
LSNDQAIKTYQISRLFYVVCFGGVIAIVVLGSRNAQWLQIDKKMIGFMMILGVAILLFKLIAIGLAAINYIQIEVKNICWIYSIGCVLLYLGYYFLMKEKFKHHIAAGGEVQPMLKDAIIWSVAGMLLESGLVVTGVGIIGYVL